MKFQFPEIDAKRFYMVGKYAFFTIGLIGLIGVVDMWGEMKSYNIFSSLASAIFYFVLSAFFSNLQGQQDSIEVKEEDIFKMNEELNKIEVKKEVQKDAQKKRRRQ